MTEPPSAAVTLTAKSPWVVTEPPLKTTFAPEFAATPPWLLFGAFAVVLTLTFAASISEPAPSATMAVPYGLFMVTDPPFREIDAPRLASTLLFAPFVVIVVPLLVVMLDPAPVA